MELCFTAWYSAGRPAAPNKYREIFPKDIHGRVPHAQMINKWRREQNWDIQADELDAKALLIRDNFLITQKADILKKQAMDAFVLADKSLGFLLSGTFDSSASAVNAYFRATDELRTVIGISEFMEKVGKMKDNELKDEIMKRLTRGVSAGALDAEEIEDTGDTEPEAS